MFKFAFAFYALFVCGATACDTFVGEADPLGDVPVMIWKGDPGYTDGAGDFSIVNAQGHHEYYVTSAGTGIPYSLGHAVDGVGIVTLRKLDGNWIVNMIVYEPICDDAH